TIDHFLDERQVDRLGAALGHTEENFDVRRLQLIFDRLRHAVRGFITQLTEHDRRRTAQIIQRSELEVEENGDRDGDGDRQRRGETQAPVVEHVRYFHAGSL